MFQRQRSTSGYSQLPEFDTSEWNKPQEKCSKSSMALIFFGLLLARLLSAWLNNINDCDETYNYWEPAHYLVYGSGFQTWEYSPQYAIRSYLYLWLYMIPAKALATAGVSKVVIFYAVRAILATVSASCETFLYSAVSKTISPQVAGTFAVISMLSAGSFSATTSFLPSSFGFYITCLVIGFYLRRKYTGFIFFTAFGAILGWPFTAAISLPVAVFLLAKKPLFFIARSAVCGIAILAVCMGVDSFYYGKPVFASMNIVLYNIFSSHGPDLYGTEDFMYYVRNLILNYNVAFAGALIAIVTIPLGLLVGLTKQEAGQQFQVLLPLIIWFGIFWTQAHKEERFMYPVYPLISLGGAIAFQNIYRLCPRNILFKIGKYSLFLIFALASLSRIFALLQGYGGSLSIYSSLPVQEGTLCLGKEWHRFPSNFLVPPGVKVEFLASEFRGQLPRHFETSEHPTRVSPKEFNDQNLEETSRYVTEKKCDFIVDSDYPQFQGRDQPYSKQPDKWSIVSSRRFLDAPASHSIFRSFYVPFLTEKHCHYIDYNLLRRVIRSN